MDKASFTTVAWAATSEVRAAIDDHPFLAGLRDGTLSQATFVGYLAQDAHYLVGYARALALCAAQATDTTEISFWASNAHDAIAVERSLHQVRVAELAGVDLAGVDLGGVDPSPTCAAYIGFLLGAASHGCYPVLAAAVLPCFWIYQDVGRRLNSAARSAGHPYQDWISTYGDADFAIATDRAKGIVDRLAGQASSTTQDRMHAAFSTACRYEWMFFDAAWRDESWPVFGAAKGSASSTATTKEPTDADSHG